MSHKPQIVTDAQAAAIIAELDAWAHNQALSLEQQLEAQRELAMYLRGELRVTAVSRDNWRGVACVSLLGLLAVVIIVVLELCRI